MALTQVSSDGVKNDAISHNKIPANAIQASELADSAVDTAAIAADAVTGAKIADDAINSEHYTDGSIDTAHIADSQVTTAKIAADAVTTSKIADNSITTALISDANVTNAKLASDAVTTSRIADNSVTSDKIGSEQVVAANIAGGTITAGKLASNSVTNAKVADDAIGIAELSATGTASSSTFLRGDNSWTAVNTDLVSDTSPQLGGDLDTNGNHILLDDSHQLRLGDDNDMQINHTGNHGYIDNGTGHMYLRGGGGSSQIILKPNGSDNSVRCMPGGAAELYHSGSKKLETTSGGASVTGNLDVSSGVDVTGNVTTTGHFYGPDNSELRLGSSDDLKISHNGSDSVITNATGNLYIQTVGNTITLQKTDGEKFFIGTADGDVELYNNGAKKLETSGSGGTLYGTWTGAGKILQVIEARKTDKFATNSGSFVDISSLTVNITPSSSSNKILVRAVVSTGMGGGGIDGFLRLLRGSTAIKLDQCTRMGSSEQNETIVLERLDTPNTTSQLTYKVQGKVSSNELFVNRDGSNDGLGESTIIVMEIAG